MKGSRFGEAPVERVRFSVLGCGMINTIWHEGIVGGLEPDLYGWSPTRLQRTFKAGVRCTRRVERISRAPGDAKAESPREIPDHMSTAPPRCGQGENNRAANLVGRIT